MYVLVWILVYNQRQPSDYSTLQILVESGVWQKSSKHLHSHTVRVSDLKLSQNVPPPTLPPRCSYKVEGLVWEETVRNGATLSNTHKI